MQKLGGSMQRGQASSLKAWSVKQRKCCRLIARSEPCRPYHATPAPRHVDISHYIYRGRGTAFADVPSRTPHTRSPPLFCLPYAAEVTYSLSRSLRRDASLSRLSPEHYDELVIRALFAPAVTRHARSSRVTFSLIDARMFSFAFHPDREQTADGCRARRSDHAPPPTPYDNGK